MVSAEIETEIQITCTYRCRIDLDVDFDTFEELATYGFNEACEPSLDYDTFMGCPAAHGYIEASGDDREVVARWRDQMLLYIEGLKS